ncbi:phage tail sheath protein [Oscillospiraceae bacterium OttesenSCG-928-F05]|nr:phage tail sheath protein [Oscillospiraceae bacterium OttesenSCG-928-F05]
MTLTTERPGVYSNYDASAVVSGSSGGRPVGIAACAGSGEKGVPKLIHSAAEALSIFGPDSETAAMAGLVKCLFQNGAPAVWAVAASVGSAASDADYATAFEALDPKEVGVLVCDNTSLTVQQSMRESAEAASAERRERIACCAMAEDSSVEALTERAAGLCCERVVLTAGLHTAAAVAGVISAETDPARPFNGAILSGVSSSRADSDAAIDTLIRGGVLPVETENGKTCIVRGVTTRTKTEGVPDTTYRELNTILVIDAVIRSLREGLGRKFNRAKNNTQTRGAIRSQVVVELEAKKAAQIIDGYGAISVTQSESDRGLCLVEFEFAVTNGLNQIVISAHIQV